MARYIDADAVLTVIKEVFHKTDVDGEEQIGVLKCHRIVRTAPTANVAPIADTVRKMQERLKAIAFPEDGCGWDCVYVKDIDQIAKELLEQESERDDDIR